jgi:purine-binding chemotaxis protein CheW
MEEGNGKQHEPVEATIHLIVFRLGAEEYGVRIEQIREVTVTPEITRMPKTPEFIKGIANIRGDIIAIMDLEERFRIKPVPNEDPVTAKTTYTLVVDSRDCTIGLVVKKVPQSLSLPVSRMDKTPAFLQDTRISDSYIEGIGKLQDRLIIVLDIFKILTGEEIRELQE